ncbi:MAG TPA: hypothetical protein DEQ49_09910, partial [Arthrobacter bacterium]|nr:hypothetical protein [Arthrobacter sp.]
LEQGRSGDGLEELGGSDVVILEFGVQDGDPLGEPEGFLTSGGSGEVLATRAPVGDLGDLGIGERPAGVNA